MSNVIINRANAKDITVGRKFSLVTGVRLIAGEDDDGNTIVYEAGNDIGYVIEVSNPAGSQAMADMILSQLSLRGFQYQAFNSNALIDPAAEIGDSVTVDGNKSVIYSMGTSHSTLMFSDAFAPFEEEVNHEYNFVPKETREYKRQIKGVRATLKIFGDEIAAKVSEEGGDNASFGWSLKATEFGLYSGNRKVFYVNSSGAHVEGEITATSGTIGGASIVNGVLQIDSANIGNINASKITAGYLSVDRLESNSVPGSKIQNTSIPSTKYVAGSVINSVLGSGAVTDGKIYANTITTGSLASGINTSLYNADDAHGIAYSSGGYGYVSARFITCTGNFYFQNHTCKWITIDGIPVISY